MINGIRNLEEKCVLEQRKVLILTVLHDALLLDKSRFKNELRLTIQDIDVTHATTYSRQKELEKKLQ